MKINLIFLIALSLFFANCDKKKKQAIPLTNVIQDTKKSNIVVVSANPEAPTAAIVGPNASVADIQPLVNVSVTPGVTDPFTFDTTNTIPVNINVIDSNGNPVSPCVVTIMDPNQNNTILLQQVTVAGGIVTGSITLPATSSNVIIIVTVGSTNTQAANVPLLISVVSNGATIVLPITSIGTITIPIANPVSTAPPIADADGDGIEDSKDAYPNDPTKATRIRFPAEGVNTIAFEDLYPNAGDADLNDYVIQFYNEEDLNAKGEIVEVRGAYQHVARGAGYTHRLKLLLPPSVNISFESSITDGTGVQQNTGLASFVPTSTQINDGLVILPDSSTTISSSNVGAGQTYVPGHVSKTKIKFLTPVTRASVGNAPYNIYMNVISTSKDVFFPGRYFNADTTDKFLDANGFPWAILVPGVWAWPLESQDIRNTSVTGYPKFQSWASSKGTADKDWYKTVTAGKVFALPSQPSSLLAYLNIKSNENAATLSALLLIIGLAFGLLVRKKIFA
jgi:LruC domain-containing protein